MKEKSKFLSLILRHDPGKIGLELDESGWANIDELIDCAARHGRKYGVELIKKIVAESDKQRFSLSEDGRFIRANQGHSIPVDLNLESVEPPDVLYHGTATRFKESIFSSGLEKRSRQHVHLSLNESTAIKVGSRHGKPVILEVLAKEMYEDGYEFYVSKNGIWLTDHVPAKYIARPDAGPE